MDTNDSDDDGGDGDANGGVNDKRRAAHGSADSHGRNDSVPTERQGHKRAATVDSNWVKVTASGMTKCSARQH